MNSFRSFFLRSLPSSLPLSPSSSLAPHTKHFLPVKQFSSSSFLSSSSPSSSSSSKVPLVSLIVIGNEVLNGQTKDKNIPTAIEWCKKKGYRLHNIQIVTDHEEAIIRAIQQAQQTTTYTLTTGGIGPTHDDITYSSVAKAYKDTVSYHQGTIDKMFKQFGFSNLSLSPRLKMALLPTSGGILEIPNSWVPLVAMEERTFIFPGIPRLFEGMLEVLDQHLEDFDKKIETYYVVTEKRESDIAEILERVEKESEGELEIGSYPNTKFYEKKDGTKTENQPKTDGFYNVRVSISTYNSKLGLEAQKRLAEALEGSAIPFEGGEE